ncbi:MAG TPA: ABC transporter permease [Opitutaceae bacterium]|jgi:NitT/TauT family transport system permease protein|nr:ABC transporter permease [Opitutaceae bacterium]
MKSPLSSRIWPPLLAGLVLLGAWYGAIALYHIPSYIFPAPHLILAATWRERRTLAQAALFTFEGAILGFLAAAVLGFIFSAVLGFALSLRRALVPYILLFQMTPVVILAPIYVLWLGQGLPAIIAISYTICFFPIVANTTLGFTSVDRNLVDLFAICRSSRLSEVFRLRFPAALPFFLTGLKIAATLACIGAITGDFLAGSAQNSVGGLGFMTVTYFSQLRIPELFGVALTACAMGFVFVGGVNLLSWCVLHQWHESALKLEK